MKGKLIAKAYEISRAGSAANCDDGVLAPAVGDIWIVYNWDVGASEWMVEGWPLKVVVEADPSVIPFLTVDERKSLLR